ncbi:carboxymuconolactone decarboxylase family protein [Aquitalea aquatica]|uniref:Carboxymuconolactone decarboxylase family protein n=1 Tax=Aquitalea aquatica TaxID=3044273 RepID=A0A838XZ02_9NEIS|nr:carboxymuconolactone decarboxylase family protein [Aquitalea magnusonii]MBA4707973.1 carboxymuconolactone decarboxylase family protein [Aquitalea magnusonii]
MPTSSSNSMQNMATEAAKLAELTESLLFGDIWQRTPLSPRERSIATVAALVALYRLEQLPFHLQLAMDNGVSRAELGELITHLAFYAGWPAAVSAVDRLADIPQAK